MSGTIDEKTHRVIGTRTTVYHVLDYSELNWPPEKIIKYLPITVEQLNAALKFIEEHKDEVMPVYREMLARDEKGNPPEVEAKLVKTREKMRKFLEERRALAKNSI